MDIRTIVNKTIYIDERYGEGALAALSPESELNRERLEEWRSLLNVDPSMDVFAKRLHGQGLTETDALRICGEAALPRSLPLPAWAVIIQDALKPLPIPEEELLQKVALQKESLKLTGPLSALFPYILYGEEQLKKIHPDLPLADLESMLFRRLYSICAPTLEGQLPRLFLTGQAKPGDKEGWNIIAKELLDGGWNGLLEKYPVLARRTGTAIGYFLAFIREFWERLQEDKALLETTFFGGAPLGRLCGIQGDISDLHQEGKCVLILSFDRGRRLVYKPRSLKIDVAWRTFTRHVTAPGTGVRAPLALDRGDYGFIEYIERRPCKDREELKAYFYNAGALMALVHALGGNDFHMDNIIARGSSPVIVDTETLMTPVVRRFSGGGGKDAAETRPLGVLERTMLASVASPGFLPLWIYDSRKNRLDVGALSGEGDGRTTGENLPVLEGEKHSGREFIPEVCGGFQAMYETILASREELLQGEKGLALFKNCRFRILLRNTQAYVNMLTHTMQPGWLQDGFDYSMRTERMAGALLNEAPDAVVPGLMKVFTSERKALQRGDVPIFYAQPEGEGIMDHRELLFPHYLEKSPPDNARERIAGMGPEDMKIQLRIIERSLLTEIRDLHDPSESAGLRGEGAGEAPCLSREALLAEAVTIFEEIMAERFAVGEEYSWLAEQYDRRRGGSALGLMGHSLYGGTLGLGVFFGALYRITGEDKHRAAADHCVRTACRSLGRMAPHVNRYRVPLGYGDGLAGYVAGLTMISDFTGNGDAVETARRLVLALSESRAREDRVLDVMGGGSGLIMVLTRDGRWLEDPDTAAHVRGLLKSCGEQLLASRSKLSSEEAALWKSADSYRTLTGYGHGVAGIAAALTRLYSVFGGEEYLSAVRDALNYENSVFDEKAGNWPDFRANPGTSRAQQRFMQGYCAGAPGVGMARMDIMKRLPGEKQELLEFCRRDLQRADAFVRDLPGEGRNHLCCGTAGRIDFLIQEACFAGEAEPMALALKKMSGLVSGKQKRGHYNFHASEGGYYYNPTLFQGTAGIGYEILRLLEPEKIPSVLL